MKRLLIIAGCAALAWIVLFLLLALLLLALGLPVFTGGSFTDQLHYWYQLVWTFLQILIG